MESMGVRLTNTRKETHTPPNEHDDEKFSSAQSSSGAEDADSLTEETASAADDGMLRLDDGQSFADAKRRGRYTI